MSALIGVYLMLSPLILGTAEGPESTLNTIAMGTALLTIGARALLTSGSIAAETIRLAFGGWLIAAPFVLGFASPAASRSACIAGILLLITADVARIAAGVCVLTHQQISRYRVSKLSPEKIADCQASETDRPVTPEALSKQIVERSEQIRKTLLANPSEVEVEMCLLGYKSCAADMLLLEGLFEKEHPKTGPTRRMKLNAARWTAIDSLTKTRGTLPPATMRTIYLGDSGEKNEQ